MNKTAQGLAALGRGPDTELVHMTKGEVAGLQSLAERHGGSLTINPATGLPEASFLESILPAVIKASAIPMADTPRYGDMGQNFGREQNYFPRAGGAASGIESVYNPQTGKFVDGEGPASKYTYDPRTQTYGGGQAEQLIKGQFGPMGGTGETSVPISNGWSDLTPAEQAAFFATHPDQSKFAQFAHGLLSKSSFGLAQNAFMPHLQPATLAVRQGYTPQETLRQGEIRARNAAEPGFYAPSIADIEANAAAMQSMQNELMADQAALAEMNAPDQTNYGGITGGFQGSFGSGSVGSPSESPGGGGGFTDTGGMGAAAAADAESGGYMASGGLTSLAVGGITSLASGPVEAMSNANTIGANTGYPQSAITPRAYATPYQQPVPQNVVSGAQDVGVNPYTGQAQFAVGGLTALAGGGSAQYNLGGYSDGGRLLRGPGDGVSDDIPAVIGQKQPARLADGEFVVPARIVSELGNGSTEAGARKLYAMMDRVQKARKKSIGKDKVAADSKAHRMLPA
jgi:hypothetical protein